MRQLTELAESKELEYKLSQNKLSKSFWETVSAFANTDGGLIVLEPMGVKARSANG
ncbi:ATP-binding protein [Lachnospiraceae bacterium]|nr:ATP-binding protein [Lachnospiraceae bacterium]